MNSYRLLVLILMMIATSWPANLVRAEEQCFPETQQCVSGRFAATWDEHGGLPVFGMPLTGAVDEHNHDTDTTYLTQWFERNRFELHSEKVPPYDILLGRLGDDRLRHLGRDWQTEGRESGPQAGCLWFAQTGHNVCDQDGNLGFKSYWESHGLNDPQLDRYARSLALFGLPLTAARIETNSSGDRVLTQWFERARFEYHPTNPSSSRVLLGLLGTEVLGTHSSPPPPSVKIPACTGYETPRWWAESQVWWQSPGQDSFDAAHMHVSACIPADETIRGNLPVDVTLSLHNNAAGVTIVGFGGATQAQSPAECYNAFIACKVFRPPLTCHTADCSFQVHLDIPTSWVGYDGRQQVRLLAVAKQPDGNEIRTGLVWESTLANGNPTKPVTLPDTIRATAWQTTVQYQFANLRALPKAPVSGIWRVDLNAPDGSASDLHDYEILVDPNIHDHKRGIVVREGTGTFKDRVAIDTNRLANGTHKLFLRAGAQGPDGKSSAVLVVPFFVQN